MRKYRLTALLLAVTLALGGCTSQTSESQTAGTEIESETQETETQVAEDALQLSVATVASWNGVVRGNVFEEYCEKLLEWSGGTMQVKLYDESVLGDDLDLIAGVQEGTLNIINSVPAYQINAVPQAALLDVPGVFTSIEQYNTMMENGYFDVMQKYYNQAGLQLLSSSAYTFRHISSNREVRSVSDLAGLRIRTMENKYHQAYWNALGATAIPLVFSELYIALRQGNMDAQENCLYSLGSSSLGEVQSYVIFTYHAPMVSNFVMNKDQYDALTDTQKELLGRFIDGVEAEVVAQLPDEDEYYQTEFAEEYGLEMIYLDDATLAEMRKGSEAALTLLRKDLGDAVVDNFLAAVEAAK